MEIKYIYQYAPVVLAVIMFLLQQKLVVTPEQLERKHREILGDAEKKFASLQMVNNLKSQMCEMKEKIDKIYDCVIKNEGFKKGE